jgi:hypothetical protein
MIYRVLISAGLLCVFSQKSEKHLDGDHQQNMTESGGGSQGDYQQHVMEDSGGNIGATFLYASTPPRPHLPPVTPSPRGTGTKRLSKDSPYELNSPFPGLASPGNVHAMGVLRNSNKGLKSS